MGALVDVSTKPQHAESSTPFQQSTAAPLGKTSSVIGPAINVRPTNSLAVMMMHSFWVGYPLDPVRKVAQQFMVKHPTYYPGEIKETPESYQRNQAWLCKKRNAQQYQYKCTQHI